MKNLPIHQNLDTAFVNLSALIRYLRRRQFVGQVRVELNGYEADITLDEGNRLNVREHALEVRGKRFDSSGWTALLDRANGARHRPCGIPGGAAIGILVRWNAKQ